MAVAFRDVSTGDKTGDLWSCALPASAVQNDCLLLMICYDATQTVSTPSGWTLEQGRDVGSNSRTATYLWSKVMGAGEPAPTIDFSGAGEAGKFAILAYSGADTTDPVESSAMADSVVGSATVTGPALTPGVNDCMIVGLFGTRDSANLSTSGTQGAGYTERLDVSQVSNNVLLYGEEKLQTTAEQDTPSYTQSNALCTGFIRYTVAIKPLAAPPPLAFPSFIRTGRGTSW